MGGIIPLFFMEVVDVVSVALGLGGACFGALSWYTGAVRKQYASERQYEHIRALVNQSFSDIEQELKFLSVTCQRNAELLSEIRAKIG